MSFFSNLSSLLEKHTGIQVRFWSYRGGVMAEIVHYATTADSVRVYKKNIVMGTDDERLAELCLTHLFERFQAFLEKERLL